MHFKLYRALKVTGHIMKVDGGKSLTSRGQQDWFGFKFMTRKFEQDYTSTLNFKLVKQPVKLRPVLGDVDGMELWCEQVQTSKWAIKSDEAHMKHTGQYSVQNDKAV